MLHSISLSSRTTSSTPAISSSYPNNKNSTLLKSTRTATTRTTAFNSVLELPFSSLPSLPLSSSPSAPALHPPSTGGTFSTKATFQPTTSFQSNNCPHISPVPRSQHQHHSCTFPPAGYPFTSKNSPHIVRPNLTRRLSTSNPSIHSSSSPFFLSSVSSCSLTTPPLLNHSPRRLCTPPPQQQQQYSQGSTATTQFSKPGVRGALADIKGASAADTAHFLDERGQPQLLKLSTHHHLLPPSHLTPSALPSWLSAAGGGIAGGNRPQQLRHQHQHQHQQSRVHHHGEDDRPGGAESSMSVHDQLEEGQQCLVDQHNTISNSLIIAADTTTTMAVGMSSRSHIMVETEGETGDSQCGGAVEVNEGVHCTVDCDDDEGTTDGAGRWNTAKTTTGDLPHQQLPTSPLTPIPTDALCKSSSSSSSSPDISVCMTPPSRSSLVGASACYSPDQQLLPGTTIMTSPATTATTTPLMEEVIGPILIMHDTNLEEQVVIHPPTPRSKPKPSPIATKSLRRANSLGLSTTNTATIAQQAGCFSNENKSINTDCNAHPATCGVNGDFLKVFTAGYRKNGGSSGRSSCSSDEEEARDSGVILEPWDQPLLQHQQQHDTRSSEDDILLRMETTPKQQQPRQPFPSFDQLFQPNLDLLDSEIFRRKPSDQQSQKRQRCHSMFYPPTPRETELDDNGSRSNDDTDPVIKDHTTLTLNSINDSRGSECILSGPSGSSTTPKSSDLKPTRRSKRVASMSIGSDHRQHPVIGPHGLPPLPPLATSTSGTFNTTTTTTTATKPQRSSFFCSPSLHDSTASDSSSSGSSSNRDSTARRPSQPPSNDSTSSLSPNFTSTSTATIPLTRPSSPPDQHHSSYHSLVGSFAHGIPFSNMLDLATAKAENITGLYFAKQMNNQPKGSGGMEPGMSTLQGSGEQREDGQAKQRTRAVTSTGSPFMDYSSVSSTGPTDLGAPPVLILDGIRIPGSPLAATTPSTPASAGTFQGAPMTKGQHRRSHSASHFFHLSSLKHHSPAQFNLALCYEHGQGGVEQDLAKALYFYQQAADQGHTKASYNLGCICYNQGEISKAMAWFESAGKCSVQGLKIDAGGLSSSSSSSSSSVSGGAPKGGVSILECPMPKATILSHELEDMLMMGDQPSGPEGSAGGAGGGGPFVAYLPAILCLALLCRQGVQTREGEVILKRDPNQAVALLQRLLDRAPARMLNKLEKGHQQNCPQLVRQQPSLRSMSASGGGRSTCVAAKRDPRKRASLQTIPTLQQQGRVTTTASSIFSTSCPQLPLELSSSMSYSSSSCSVSTTLAGSGSGGVRAKRPSTVEDAVDDSDDEDEDESSSCPEESRSNKTIQDSRQFSGFRQPYCPNSEKDHQEEEEKHGSDVHEAWSVTLAQQLLKAWQQSPPSNQTRATPGSASMEDDGRIQQRIVRHHLLYITNPTLGKNFYNLGVLYDLYLGHAQIAQRCYRSAYQNCRPCLLPLTPVSVQNDTFAPYAATTDGALKQQHQQLQLAELVTRINSAWNLGVLHAKHQEWARARSWFLKAQQDVLAHERIVAASVGSIAQDQRQRRGGGQSAGRGEKDMVSDLAALLMKQGGGGGGGEEAEWSSKVEELLSLGSSGNNASEKKQRRAVVSEKYGGADVVQQDEEDMGEFKTRRKSLVNVLPSPAPGRQSNISARGGRGEQRGRSGGRTSGNDGSDAKGVALLGTKDSPGSRHAREHGLMMYLSSSSAGSSSSSKMMDGGVSSAVKSGGKKGSSSSLSREGGNGGRGGSGGSDGIRTDASKVAWVLRWVESNMDSPSSTSSLSL